MRDIPQALSNLETWLERTRCPGGYGGPVAHWWSNCLAYTGPGLDWRYEGIIRGYLDLWQRTGQRSWLDKACRAGDDLVGGQLPGGNFRNSSFELNPYPAGTPHEAAVCLALLRLALALREQGDPRWSGYAVTAEENICSFQLDKLWSSAAGFFFDHPGIPSLVPNKLCTLVEALFAWAELRADDHPIEGYARSAMSAAMGLQLNKPARLAGAIAQGQFRKDVVEAYFPFYIARCIPALLLTFDYTGRQQWLDAATAAFDFVTRQVDGDGLLPQVIYWRGVNRYPQWIAPLGDVLQVARLLEGYGRPFDLQTMENRLLKNQLPSGAFPTARGFAAQISQRSTDVNDRPPDFRDILPVVGWNDKTFRYLATRLETGAILPPPDISPVNQLCRLDGESARCYEDQESVRVSMGDELLYTWQKGQDWVRTASPGLLWR